MWSGLLFLWPMKIPAKIPRIVKWVYPEAVFNIGNQNNAVFLTFDDGPTPEITPWVLAELAKVNAKATFFLIGNNAVNNPAIVDEIQVAGHAIGNHTFNHEKGWITEDETYVQSVAKTDAILGSQRFRPPYGRIKKSQIKQLKKRYKIILWDVLSGDYDNDFSPEECAANVLANVQSGSIIVFHDSVKAWPNLKIALPLVLKQLVERGFVMQHL